MSTQDRPNAPIRKQPSVRGVPQNSPGRRKSNPSLPPSFVTNTNYTPNTSNGFFSKISEIAFGAVSNAGKIAQKGVSVAGDLVDKVGLKDKVEMAESNFRKLATRGRNDANKALNKTRRLATRAFVFEEGESFNYEYDLLLSNAGAVERNIAAYGNHSPMFGLPAGQGFVYKARVKKGDINLTVREVGPDSQMIILESSQRYLADVLIQGYIPPVNEPRTINLYFDNSHSPLQGKVIAYYVQMGEGVSLKDDQNSGERTKEMIAAEEGPSD